MLANTFRSTIIILGLLVTVVLAADRTSSGCADDDGQIDDSTTYTCPEDEDTGNSIGIEGTIDSDDDGDAEDVTLEVDDGTGAVSANLLKQAGATATAATYKGTISGDNGLPGVPESATYRWEKEYTLVYEYIHATPPLSAAYDKVKIVVTTRFRDSAWDPQIPGWAPWSPWSSATTEYSETIYYDTVGVAVE